MSFDPYVSDPERPLSDNRRTARQRVLAPGILLIVVGALNLLAAIAVVASTIDDARKTPEQLRQEQQENLQYFPKEWRDAMDEDKDKTPEAAKREDTIMGVVVSVLVLAGGILSLLGGVRMIQLRSYGLSVTGAVVAAIPCVSVSACCGFGEVAGTWALVVLLNLDVREAFQ